MNWKNIFTTAAKQAVSAAIATLTAMWQTPAEYNWHTVKGVQHITLLVLSAVAVREALVWLPKISAWAQSPDTPEQAAQAIAKIEVKQEAMVSK